MNKAKLQEVAADTKAFLEDGEKVWEIAHHAIFESIPYGPDNPAPRLKADQCPCFLIPITKDHEADGYINGARVEVINADAFEAAITLSNGLEMNDPYVCVLNLGNPNDPGGGWESGAKAQEEYLCYRSTLSATLHPEDYPISGPKGIYSPAVAIIKSSEEKGYQLLESAKMVSVVTIAATNQPKVFLPDPNKFKDKYLPPGQYFVDPKEPALLREKIRIALRIAAYHGHSRIVLGALGCGQFSNPGERVAELFFHVFMEKEFSGGWWEHVVFAIKDVSGKKATGWRKNQPFDIFWRKLHGLVV